MNKNTLKIFYLVIILLFYPFYTLSAQDSLLVTGRIVGHKNKPLKDVSVSIEGVAIDPVLTDENGLFKITSPSLYEWLIITPIGNYKGKRIFLNNRKSLIISLTGDDMKSDFDEIHVVNQTIERRNIISSFSDVNIDDIDRSSIQSIDQYFQGRVPGLLVTGHSGMPGMGNNILLRGVKSMLTNNNPLYIIDGIPLEQAGLMTSQIDGFAYNPLNNIDPSDITSITILKDPAFTSLYGTKASNGVILIQTLEPVATKTIIDVSYRTGINQTPDYIPQLNSEQYKSLVNEILTSSGKKEEYFEENYPGLYITEVEEGYYRYQHNFNWQKIIFSNSTMRNFFMRVKGGGEMAKFGLSVGHINDKGIYDNTGYSRINLRFLTRLDITSWFRMDINANIAYSNVNLRESAITKQTNPILTSLAKSPLLNPFQYDEDGNKLKLLDDIDELGTSNPLAVINDFQGSNKNYRFISLVKGQADITPFIKWNSLFGLNFNSTKEFVFMPNYGMDLYYSGEVHNVSQSVNNYLYCFYTDNYLSFDKKSNNNDLNFTTGIRLNTNMLQNDWGEARNAPENDEYNTLESGESDLRRIGGENGKWNWLSMYGKLNYIFHDKYLLSAGGSVDFSSRVGDEANGVLNIRGVPFGFFYSIGGAWRISSERFLKNIKGLESLKLRVSYGTSGNDDIGNYNAYEYYTVVKFRETTGLIPGSLPNTSLKFEETSEFNIGLDLSIWGNRSWLTFDYYILNTENMLLYEPKETYLGFLYQLINKGKINNQGWELLFYQRILDGENFKWDGILNVSHYTNKVKDLGGKEIITPFQGGEFITREGQPINNFYGYQYEGVFTNYKEAGEAGLINDKGIPYGAGDAKYKDISGPSGEPDSVINIYDKTIIGSTNPDYFGSIINKFRYKKWYLNIMIQFVYGNKVYNYIRYHNERMTDFSNQSQNVLKRWQYDGDITNVPRALWNDPLGNSSFSSRWIEDGSYLRLKSITFGYNIPDKFLVFRNADFFITATNLITLDEYLGYDPEFSYSFKTMEQGIDYGLMPQHRKFLIGVKLGL